MHSSLYGSANKQRKLEVFHLVMFHMQSTYLLRVDSSSESTVFFCSRLSVRLDKFFCNGRHHLHLHCWHLLWKDFTPYTFDSDYLDTLLNGHYLMKQSSVDK